MEEVQSQFTGCKVLLVQQVKMCVSLLDNIIYLASLPVIATFQHVNTLFVSVLPYVH